MRGHPNFNWVALLFIPILCTVQSMFLGWFSIPQVLHWHQGDGSHFQHRLLPQALQRNDTRYNNMKQCILNVIRLWWRLQGLSGTLVKASACVQGFKLTCRHTVGYLYIETGKCQSTFYQRSSVFTGYSSSLAQGMLTSAPQTNYLFTFVLMRCKHPLQAFKFVFGKMETSL